MTLSKLFGNRQVRFSFKNIVVLIKFGKYQVFIVKFIADVAYNFFNNVLQGNNSRSSSVFINHHSEVVLFVLEFQQ